LKKEQETHFDFIIIGSGFGGSVSALRLIEKGYSVLVVEKGRRFGPADFPKNNWNLKNWMWLPRLNWRGFYKMTFFRNVTVMSGVGVGGGSLGYANTLPVPPNAFFKANSWAHLGDWESELMPHYDTAKRMLGVAENPHLTAIDDLLKEVAEELGCGDKFKPSNVGVYFGESGVTVPDPYFQGEGPERTGCIYCGACMTGCAHGAKNTLDKNYLFLAEKRGVSVMPETEVMAVRPREEGGYLLEASQSLGWFRSRGHLLTADQVIFSGGVLGTVDLLLKMKAERGGLPRLSQRLGCDIRTNSESLIGVITPDKNIDFTEGIAISSIVHIDEVSHVEPVRYGKGSNFFRLMILPHAPGSHLFLRIANSIRAFFRYPVRWLKALTVRQFAKQSFILLFMRTSEGTLRFKRKRGLLNMRRGRMISEVSEGEEPKAFMPEATDIAERMSEKLKGVPISLMTETLLGTPSTAHILGGCCMGSSSDEGVIDTLHQVFDYPGLYVIDGSTVSANPGVNPSLTITAMAERAMSFIPTKGA
jgi:cholesterol oxidase